jgi:hypothetical protein
MRGSSSCPPLWMLNVAHTASSMEDKRPANGCGLWLNGQGGRIDRDPARATDRADQSLNDAGWPIARRVREGLAAGSERVRRSAAHQAASPADRLVAEAVADSEDAREAKAIASELRGFRAFRGCRCRLCPCGYGCGARRSACRLVRCSRARHDPDPVIGMEFVRLIIGKTKRAAGRLPRQVRSLPATSRSRDVAVRGRLRVPGRLTCTVGPDRIVHEIRPKETRCR